MNEARKGSLHPANTGIADVLTHDIELLDLSLSVLLYLEHKGALRRKQI